MWPGKGKEREKSAQKGRTERNCWGFEQIKMELGQNRTQPKTETGTAGERRKRGGGGGRKRVMYPKTMEEKKEEDEEEEER